MNKSIHNSFFIVVISTLFLVSCSKDDQSTTLETKSFSNLYAPQNGGQGQPASGQFTRFSFATNSIVTDNSWDIAFRGTTIIVNGGTKVGLTDEPDKTGTGAISIVSSTLDSVKTTPDVSTFKQDGTGIYAIPTGSNNGWYNYNPNGHLITPLPNKIFVVKTHNNKYAKLQITSYYKNSPASPGLTDSTNYYSFKFVYQPSGNTF